MEEQRTTEVVHEITLEDDSIEEEDDGLVLDGVDLNDTRAILLFLNNLYSFLLDF